MSQPTADAKHLGRAFDALTTQVRRVADAMQTPVVDTQTTPDDAPTTPPGGPRCAVCGSPEVRYRNYREQPFCWPCANGEQPAPADDEEQQRTTRRASLRNLLDRTARGHALQPQEADALRQHVDSEVREHDTMRAVAAGNKRHVQMLYADLQEAQRDRDRSDEAARAAIEQRQEMAEERHALQRDRDQHAAVLSEVLAAFVHKVHGYLTPRRSAEVDVVTLDKWRSMVAPTVERPWWEAVAEAKESRRAAEAAVERVRALIAGRWGAVDPDLVTAALDGPTDTEQQPDQDPIARLLGPELDALQTRITKARALHASHASGSADCTQRCERAHPDVRVCNGCGWTAPCPTARALDGTEQPTTED